MGATPPARYALRRGGEGSVACSVARKPARPRGSLPSKLSLREGCAASRSGPRPRPWAWTRSAPVSFLEDALSRVSPGLLYALVAALSVELAAVSLLDFPAFGLVPILDLISFESPRFYAVIRAWYYLAPACVVFAASLVLGELATRFFSRGGRVAFGRFHDAGTAALELLGRALSWRVVFSLVAGIAAYGWAERVLPFPRLGENPILDLVALEDPLAYYTIRLWCLAVPGLAAFGGGLILSGSWRVWLESRRGSRRAGRGTLPRWPAEADDAELQLVLGELHHPTDAKEVAAPQWLTLPERGLFTGIAIFGAVGSGKTSACMHPYARQIFHWRADDPKRRAAGLVLEVKGDFCHDVRRILEDAGRGDDYIEIALGGSWQWNPLDSDMDSYSLAYSVASLLNQLFGKGKEPFWQQAYTNLIRWTIELHRTLPGGWVTLAISTAVPSTRRSSTRRSRKRRSHRRGRHRPGPLTSRSMAGSSSFSRTPSSLVTIGRRAGPASCGPPTTRSS